jgi:hypothetical protein
MRGLSAFNAFYFDSMTAYKDRSKEKETAGPLPELRTEYPLFEKDQQGMAAERGRKLAEQALERWRRLQQNVKTQPKIK